MKKRKRNMDLFSAKILMLEVHIKYLSAEMNLHDEEMLIFIPNIYLVTYEDVCTG